VAIEKSLIEVKFTKVHEYEIPDCEIETNLRVNYPKKGTFFTYDIQMQVKAMTKC
jgi:hypothetical protein